MEIYLQIIKKKKLKQNLRRFLKSENNLITFKNEIQKRSNGKYLIKYIFFTHSTRYF